MNSKEAQKHFVENFDMFGSQLKNGARMMYEQFGGAYIISDGEVEVFPEPMFRTLRVRASNVYKEGLLIFDEDGGLVDFQIVGKGSGAE